MRELLQTWLEGASVDAGLVASLKAQDRQAREVLQRTAEAWEITWREGTELPERARRRRAQYGDDLVRVTSGPGAPDGGPVWEGSRRWNVFLTAYHGYGPSLTIPVDVPLSDVLALCDLILRMQGWSLVGGVPEIVMRVSDEGGRDAVVPALP